MKYENQMKILAPIIAQMKDFTPDLYGVSLSFGVWGGRGCGGSQAFGKIKVFICEHAWDAMEAGQKIDPMVLGQRVLRAIAHEFRHTQQEALWEENIPSVSWMVRADNTGDRSPEWSWIAYTNDKGEMDAKLFAHNVVRTADPAFVRLIGRLSTWIGRKQFEEWHAKEEACCNG